jgi:hypothetical protein
MRGIGWHLAPQLARLDVAAPQNNSLLQLLLLLRLMLMLMLIMTSFWSPCSCEGLRGQRLHHCAHPLISVLERVSRCSSTGRDHSRTLSHTTHWTG